MWHDVTTGFTQTFINPITNLLLGRRETLSETERKQHGNCHRPEHNRLCQPFPAHREHGRDLPGHRDAGRRRAPDPDHSGNHLCDLRDSGCRGRNDQRTCPRTLPVTGVVKHGKCNGNRPEHHRLRKPVVTHRKYGWNISGDRNTCCRSTSDPHNAGDHQRDLRNTRCGSRDDRRVGTRTLPVNRNTTFFGSLQAPTILLLLLSSIVIPAIVMPVLADITVSFSPLNLDAETLLISNSTGALIGVYNTSTKGIVLVNNETYSILVQPESSNLMTNHPDVWFTNFLAYLQAHIIGIVVIVFLVAVLIAAYKRR